MNLKNHDSLYFFQICPSIFMCKESLNAYITLSVCFKSTPKALVKAE